MVIILLWLAFALPAQSASDLKNPVATSAESVANGAKIFARNCAACHGKEGKGDGLAGAKLEPKPSNLADAEWKHGSTDGDIFTVIHDGVKNTGMKAYGSRLTERELWDLVNYVRSLKE
jgi:mono/diheme cytochrome c family protein